MDPAVGSMAYYISQVASTFGLSALGLTGMAGTAMVVSLVAFLAHRLAKAGR
jgi:hypothetical protein